MTTTHTPVALNLPTVVPSLIVYGRHMVQAMTNNPWFPSPFPPLDLVTADLDALEAAEVTTRSRAKGTVAIRNLKRRAVDADLIGLKGYVQWIADQHPADAEAVITSAGMAPKRFTPRQKPELSARMGEVPGEVLLRAKAAGKVVAYMWQSSSDGGTTWDGLGTTTVADTSVVGLAAGASYLFRFCTTIKKTTGEWSQAIRFLVH